MRVAICDARKGKRDAANSITVAYRNMIELAGALHADVFFQASDFARPRQPYDAIICGFGSMACECDRQLDFIKRNSTARLYWLVGEYEQSTFAPLFYACRDQRRTVHVIKNYLHGMKCSYAHAQTYVAFNSLLARRPNKATEKKHDAIYWGRWRQDREPYFRRYLQSPVWLSTSPKNMKRFLKAGCAPRFARAMTWDAGREALNAFRYSLYIEDVFTHTHYNGLANRFYEALFCNVAQFFDVSCKGTLDKSGISIDKYAFVSSAEELRSKVADNPYQDMMAEQARWITHAIEGKVQAIRNIEKIIGQ